MFIKNWDKMSEDEARTRQGIVLHRFLKEQVLKYSPFYKELFRVNGLGADDIKTVEDLQKLPFTSKADIAPSADAPNRPRQLVLQPDRETYASTIGLGKKLSLLLNKLITEKDFKEQVLDEYLPVFFIATTGRTANPTPFLYSSRDMRFFREASRRIFTIAGARRESDFAFSAFPYAPHLAFWIVYQGGIMTGVPMFHSGGGKVFGTDRLITSIQKFGATILVGIPGYIYHVLRLAAERNSDFSKIRMIVLGAERVTIGLKKRIKDLLESMGAKDPIVMSTFGFTEARVAWIECPIENSIENSMGYHLFPDMEIFEIVDPKTGKAVGDGESGEIVYTSLDWRGSVVLRYRTGDYARGGITWKPCPACGRKVPRMTTDITRLSDQGELQLSKIKGTLIDFNEFFPIMTSVSDIIEWQIEITKHDEDPNELDELHVHLSIRPDANKSQVQEMINGLVKERMEISVGKFHFWSPEEIAIRLGMDERPKELRIVDRRPELESKDPG